MSKIQRVKPNRTFLNTYNDYKKYKEPLRNDFNKRCGYCDDDDFFTGGKRGYHIDHFKPKHYFNSLINNYDNLVYSCPYCNNSKSDKWKDIDGFIDPCDIDYDNHIFRNDKGQIEYCSKRGKYIHENLQLGLKRHELLWLIFKLKEQKDELYKIKENLPKGDKKYEILEQYCDLDRKLLEYHSLYEDEI